MLGSALKEEAEVNAALPDVVLGHAIYQSNRNQARTILPFWICCQDRNCYGLFYLLRQCFSSQFIIPNIVLLVAGCL